jgi:hypothetical protein
MPVIEHYVNRRTGEHVTSPEDCHGDPGEWEVAPVRPTDAMVEAAARELHAGLRMDLAVWNGHYLTLAHAVLTVALNVR